MERNPFCRKGKAIRFNEKRVGDLFLLFIIIIVIIYYFSYLNLEWTKWVLVIC